MTMMGINTDSHTEGHNADVMATMANNVETEFMLLTEGTSLKVLAYISSWILFLFMY